MTTPADLADLDQYKADLQQAARETVAAVAAAVVDENWQVVSTEAYKLAQAASTLVLVAGVKP